MLALSHATVQQVCQLEMDLLLGYFVLCHFLCCTYILAVMLQKYAQSVLFFPYICGTYVLVVMLKQYAEQCR